MLTVVVLLKSCEVGLLVWVIILIMSLLKDIIIIIFILWCIIFLSLSPEFFFILARNPIIMTPLMYFYWNLGIPYLLLHNLVSSERSNQILCLVAPKTSFFSYHLLCSYLWYYRCVTPLYILTLLVPVVLGVFDRSGEIILMNLLQVLTSDVVVPWLSRFRIINITKGLHSVPEFIDLVLLLQIITSFSSFYLELFNTGGWIHNSKFINGRCIFNAINMLL